MVTGIDPAEMYSHGPTGAPGSREPSCSGLHTALQTSRPRPDSRREGGAFEAYRSIRILEEKSSQTCRFRSEGRTLSRGDDITLLVHHSAVGRALVAPCPSRPPRVPSRPRTGAKLSDLTMAGLHDRFQWELRIPGPITAPATNGQAAVPSGAN